MSTASVSSSTSNSFYTSNGLTHMNGTEFASGLDIQQLITAMTSKTTAKITLQQQLQQKAEWKQSMYRDIESLIQTFSDKYLSYAAGNNTNIMSSSFFDSGALVSSNSRAVTATGAASDAGNIAINSITQLASAASSATGHDVSIESIKSSDIVGNFVSSSSYLSVYLGGKGKLYTLNLGSAVDLSGADQATAAQKLADQLNSQVGTCSDLKDAHVTFTAANGSLSMTSTGGAVITGASQNFLGGLGMTNSGTAGSPNYSLGAVNQSALTDLPTQLEGTSLSFKLDGIAKSVTFDKSDSAQYSNPAGIATYLQKKIDAAYGSSKISVGLQDDGKLAFTASDSTSVLQLSSSTDGGVLGIAAGETNRTETDKTLKNLSSELATPLTPVNGSYSITVNGKSFTFTEDTELSSVINTINNDTDANVTISYSQTLNQFRIVSDDTGAGSQVKISDVSGNLATSLFGNSSDIVSKDLKTTTGYTTGSSASTYSITAGGTTASITLAANQTYSTLADYQNAVQSAINSSTLNGKVTVGASDGKLTFQTTDNSALSITVADNTKDTLGLGAQSTSSISKQGTDLGMNVTMGGVSQGITRSTNSFTLDGVTLDVAAETNQKVTFSASTNVDDLYKKISDFVDTYNAIIAKANKYTTDTPYGLNSGAGTNTEYAPLTDDQKKGMTDDEIKQWNDKAQQGLLENDDALNALLTNFRSAMEQKVESVGLSLDDIGIGTASHDWTSGGKMVINDETKLKDALRSEPDKVAQLFTDTDGIAARLKNVVTDNIGAYGSGGALVDIAGSSTSMGVDSSQLSQQISGYNDVIKQLKTQLQSEQDYWQAKFTNMEQLIYTLTAQSNYLSGMTSQG